MKVIRWHCSAAAQISNHTGRPLSSIIPFQTSLSAGRKRSAHSVHRTIILCPKKLVCWAQPWGWVGAGRADESWAPRVKALGSFVALGQRKK